MKRLVRNNLVIVALHHERWHRDRFQIVRLVCLGERLDAFVMCQRAAHHPLTPPILDDPLRWLRARMLGETLPIRPIS